ncbi:MAG TPA: thiamine pyrophosphate-requiring protein [Streptosporangiaceae bacterium]|nr:thiamine pyrophosphate-requiring protein [Streptosporangiaceae bacterium]
MGDHTGPVFPDAAAELVGTLADEGVEHLFINPGTDTAPVQEAMAAARANGTPHPRSVLCTHEFVALSAAMGHHFAGGGPQAVMVHVDAGTLNLGGAIHNAQRNRVPVVIFAGRTPYSIAPEVPGHRDTYIHWQQEQADQQAILRAFGKWSMEVPRGRELGGIVRRAYQVARSDPPGPAYVMLPRESLMEPGGAALSRRLRRPRPAAPDPGGLAEAARALADARRPVIITGRTGARPDAVAALVELAELIGSPVIDHQDRLNFPPRHPLFAGGEVDGADELRAADVVLVLDAEVPWIPVQAAPPPDAVVLQIDIDCVKHTMPTWTYPVELALTASTAIALPLLTAELRGLATPDRTARWRERRAAAGERLDKKRTEWAGLAVAEPPDAMLQALDRALPPEAIVLEEAVTNRPAIIRQVAREPGHRFGTGSPALGWGVAGALGVKLARPDAPVVSIVGDGAFNFGVPTAAIWSAQKAGAPFIAVILNNQAYRASKLPVQRLYPKGSADTGSDFPETDLTPAADYVQLARAYGGDGRVVERPEDLPAALEHCLETQAAGRCAILDVRLPVA